MRREPVPGAAIVAEARRWRGVPWRHLGRSRAGLDCVGLLVVIARALELPHRDLTGYSRHGQPEPDGDGLPADVAEHFRAQLGEIRCAEARPGDVLVFAQTVRPCHAGVLSEVRGAAHLVHAHAGRRVVLEEPMAGVWAARLRLAFRFPDMRGGS